MREEYEEGNIEHFPVMLKEIVHYLAPVHNTGLFIDSTLGEGGHSEAFLNSYQDTFVLGIDADSQILQRAKQRLKPFGERVQFYHGFYDDFFQNYPLKKAPTTILFDLGISSYHFKRSGRGFSFSSNEYLDMRMNTNVGEPLAQILGTISEEDIITILRKYGEEQFARRIAKNIVIERRKAVIQTASQLALIINASVPAEYRRKRIHAATRSFQAFRIFVNAELERLERALRWSFQLLELGGRIGVISFHSLEDRIVKNIFKELSKPCICSPKMPICECGGKALAQLPFKKVLVPSVEEVNANPPSRSAKFRVIEKLREQRTDN